MSFEIEALFHDFLTAEDLKEEAEQDALEEYVAKVILILPTAVLALLGFMFGLIIGG